MKNLLAKERLNSLIEIYQDLANKHKSGVAEIMRSEVAEAVYNSNAIENSTLTLEDTENILLKDQIRTDHSICEIFEAKNLGNVTDVLIGNPTTRISITYILALHRTLMTGINNGIAGRFRTGDEWVRVGNHIGANPDFVAPMMYALVDEYNNTPGDFLEKIAHFHGEIENIHPFIDGNGRIGRVLINQQLIALNLPPIIIRSKDKFDSYYPTLEHYEHTRDFSQITELLTLLLTEALHKYIVILQGQKYIPLKDWAIKNGILPNIANNKARRQTIPAFRVNNKWMIAEDFIDTESVETL